MIVGGVVANLREVDEVAKNYSFTTPIAGGNM